MAARESETVLKQANINPVAVMGSDGTNLYLMKVGSDGSIGLIPSLQTTADLTEAVVNIADRNGEKIDRGNFTAEELRAAAAVLTQLADGLDWIAAEKDTAE